MKTFKNIISPKKHVFTLLLLLITGVIIFIITTGNPFYEEKQLSDGENNSQESCDIDLTAKSGTFCSEQYGFSFEVPSYIKGELQKSETADQSTDLDESKESSTFIEAKETYSYKLSDEDTTFDYSVSIYPIHRLYLTNGTDEGSYFFDETKNTFVNTKTNSTIDESQSYKVVKKSGSSTYSTDLSGEFVDLSQNVFNHNDQLIVVKVRTQQSASENAVGSKIDLSKEGRESLQETLKLF